jgi:hypothetical protein
VRWLDVRCDALSLNLIVLAAAGVLGLLIANTVLSDQHPIVRLAVAAGFGTLGAGLFAMLEPACLAGPFGQVPQAVRPIWLDNVMETYSLWRYFTQAPNAALAVALFLAIGTAAAIRVWWQNRSAANLFTLGVTLLGAACAAWQIKYLPYVTWLVLPSLATAVAGFDGTRSISPLAGRLVGLLLFNQYTAIIVGGLALSLTGASASDKLADVLKQRRDCYRMSNIAALRDLPVGRIVSDTTMGPFVIAGSGHSALSAPYHRIPEAILAGHTIFAGTADEARRGLAASGIDYVLVCSTYQDPLVSASGTNLASLLARGSAPGYLDPVTLPTGNPLRLWRVQRP